MQLSNCGGGYRNTQTYSCQYANVFDKDNTVSYIAEMSKMREMLEFLMASKGDDAYSLQVKSGVPQPTTQRFLTGKHGDPRSSTVRKWAKAYGITESQMRGDVPLDGVNARSPAKQSPSDAEKTEGAAKSAVSLTKEQQKILSVMGSIGTEAREALLKAVVLLAQSNQSQVTDAVQKPQSHHGVKEESPPVELGYIETDTYKGLGRRRHFGIPDLKRLPRKADIAPKRGKK